MSKEFYSTKGKTYHIYRDCRWLVEIPDEHITSLQGVDIEEKSIRPCMGCTRRRDLVNAGYEDNIAAGISYKLKEEEE